MGRFNNTPAVAEKKTPAMPQYQQNQPVAQMSLNSAIMTPAVAREVATIMAQVTNAKMNPRYMPAVYSRLDNLCAGVKLANGAMYAYARGGSDIHGPSIRLAEAVASSYGNLKYGFEVTDSDDMTNTVRAYAYDMESNTQAERIFKVANLRHTKNGDTILTDPRDIYENVANNASRRIRACILEIIPQDVIDYAVELCDKTRAAHCDLAIDTIRKMQKAFESKGVSKAMLEAFAQRKLENIQEVQYLRLKEIWVALEDGVAKVEDFFTPDAQPEAGEPNTDTSEPKAEPVAEPASEQEPHDGPENFKDEVEF